jgi:hypothetical protein
MLSPIIHRSGVHSWCRESAAPLSQWSPRARLAMAGPDTTRAPRPPTSRFCQWGAHNHDTTPTFSGKVPTSVRGPARGRRRSVDISRSARSRHPETRHFRCPLQPGPRATPPRPDSLATLPENSPGCVRPPWHISPPDGRQLLSRRSPREIGRSATMGTPGSLPRSTTSKMRRACARAPPARRCRTPTRQGVLPQVAARPPTKSSTRPRQRAFGFTAR